MSEKRPYSKRMQKCGVYIISNLINNKVYIGQSVFIGKRWSEHRRDYQRKTEDSLLYKAMNKYGIHNFSWKVLEECTPEELDEREIFYIHKYRSYVGFKDCNGYNSTLGGRGGNGFAPSEVTKKTWSKNRSGGKNGMAIPVICEGIEYPTIKECAEHYKVEKTSMQKWLQQTVGMPPYFVERQLRYKGTEFVCKKYHANKGVPIIYKGQYYSSIRQCAKHYNVSPETIKKWISKERRN